MQSIWGMQVTRRLCPRSRKRTRRGMREDGIQRTDRVFRDADDAGREEPDGALPVKGRKADQAGHDHGDASDFGSKLSWPPRPETRHPSGCRRPAPVTENATPGALAALVEHAAETRSRRRGLRAAKADRSPATGGRQQCRPLLRLRPRSLPPLLSLRSIDRPARTDAPRRSRLRCASNRYNYDIIF